MTEEMNEQKYYQLAISGPPVAPSEIEGETTAVEVVVSWGDVRDVLAVAHVEEDGRFVLGAEGETDFLMNESDLGASSFVLVENGRLNVPAGASGTMKLDGEEAALAGVDMREGVEASLQLGEFRVLVRGVKVGKKIASRSRGLERRPLFFVGGTMLVTGLLLGIMSLTPPHGMAMTHDRLDTNSRLVNYAIDAQELVQEEIEFTQDESNGGDEGGAERGDEGEAGDRDAAETDNAYAIEGSARREDQQLSREERREQATTAGILGVLPNAIGPLSPTSVYGADTAIGADPMSALGAIMGVDIGDNHGFNGLGLNGTGRHGGGRGLGTIGLGDGGIGRGLGCDDDGPCLGGGRGPSGAATAFRRRASRGPIMRRGTPEVMGSLSAETIRRVVRRHHNEVKFCFERALQTNPELEGRVTTRFVISPSGAVVAASIAGSSLHHAATESCVTDVVRRFSFPQPDNAGMVSVTYPFSFVAN